MRRQLLFSRRAVVALAGSAGLAVAAATWGIPYSRRMLIRRLNEGAETTGVPTLATLRVVADFTGALMGRRLTAAHIEMLTERLQRSAKRYARWASQYSHLAQFADKQARELDRTAAGFADASDAVRETIVQGIMSAPASPQIAKIAVLFSADERTIWGIRNGTANHLRLIYRRSKVPWQLRGYRGAPGAPVDRLDYTRPVSVTG